jgi:hypothetical protein
MADSANRRGIDPLRFAVASGHSEEWSSPLLELDFEDGLHWFSDAVGTYTLDPRHSATGNSDFVIPGNALR